MHRNPTTEIPIAQAKKIVHDLFTPNPFVYWADFLFTTALGWAAFIAVVKTPLFSLPQILAYLVAGLALYRSVLFVHELSHLKKGTFRLFHWAWNLLCGFPLMFPAFLYVGVHPDHHKQRIYGTKDDPEYFAFALAKPRRIILFLLTMVVAPAFFLLRFLVLTPFSYFVWPLRKPLWERASHLAAGGPYRRPMPDNREKLTAGVQEFMTFVYGAVGLTLMVKGIMPWKVLAVWYLTAVFILVTNALRSLAAHCDHNPPDHVASLTEQFLDSTDIPGNPLMTPLWAPVGLRFHATHHLFIGIPYHNLGEAHRRLMSQLPDSCPYALAYREGLRVTLWELWKEARRNSKA